MAEEHNGQHHNCPPCFKIKVKTVQFEGAGERAIEIRQRDRKFENVDGPAYQRLKADGIQPNNVDGSALLEAAMDHPIEAAMGTNLQEHERAAMKREGLW